MNDYFIIRCSDKDLASEDFWLNIMSLNDSKVGKFVVKTDGDEKEDVFYSATDFECEYDYTCELCAGRSCKYCEKLLKDDEDVTIKCYYGSFLNEWLEWYKINKPGSDFYNNYDKGYNINY